MNLRNIFTTALGCFTILAACGNDNDSNITPTPEPKPDQPTEEAKDVTLYVTNTSRTYDLTKSGLAFGTGSNMSPSTVTLDPATRYQEMDGFGANEGIIVLAATNRADILDPALMRPGRFDRQVYVGYPDQKARLAILKVHSKNKPLSKDVDLSVIAKTTYGFTGADLENLLNEAALLAARENLTEITPHHLDDAMLKVVMGPEKKSREVQEKDKKQTAYHEAGHAVASKNLETQDKVHQVSIIPRGRAGGFTMSLPDHDKAYISKREMIEDIVTMMGGRVAEEMIFGEINTGASSDIQRATKVATEMVTKYGMSDKLGSRTFGSNEEIFIGRDYGHAQEYSDATAALIDEEIDKIIADAYKQCQELLKAHRDELEAVAQALIEKEVLTGEEFDAVIKSVHEDGSEASVQEESAERQDNE